MTPRRQGISFLTALVVVVVAILGVVVYQWTVVQGMAVVATLIMGVMGITAIVFQIYRSIFAVITGRFPGEPK